MTTFFIDLWHDLRERRLWPVAVGLLAAIVAVPAILFKPASDAAPPAVSAPKTNGADTLPVVSVDAGPTLNSHLEAFSQRNPFQPMKDLAKDTGSGDSAGGSSDGGSSAGGSSGGTGGTSGDSTGGATGGGTSTGGSTGGGTTGDGTTNPGTKWFHYTADFSFGVPGEKAETFENVGSFTLLPDESTPAVVFVGIDGDHKSAMFFVNDPGVVAEGEGDCNAKGAECRFVTLKLEESSDEETFTALDGSVSWELKLLDINREELGTGIDPAPADPPKNAKGFGATGAGVAAATSTTQSVIPDVFAIGPAVASEGQ